MPLDIIETGQERYELRRDGRQAGWIRGRTVGLRGFDTTAEAQYAARAAYDALRVWLAKQRRTELPAAPRGTLKTKRQGDVTLLTLDGIPIGRTVTLVGGEPAHHDYGFELDLPPQLGPSVAVSAAQEIDDALSRRAEARQLEEAATGS